MVSVCALVVVFAVLHHFIRKSFKSLIFVTPHVFFAVAGSSFGPPLLLLSLLLAEWLVLVPFKVVYSFLLLPAIHSSLAFMPFVRS